MRVIAVIPARGGSVGIPRKNARLIGGQPLLSYVIRAAQASSRVDGIYVSTDDSELAYIAESHGISVLNRPPELAGPQVTLDAVVIDAVKALETRGEVIDCVVTLQPTSPLIQPHTIDAAVELCLAVGAERESFDTVMTVVSDKHLTWRRLDDGSLAPNYASRVNRQELPATFRETGGVVVALRQTLQSGSRIGPQVGVLEVSKTEAIDIDDHFDWWLAEKSLGRKHLCFNVVGSRDTGLGHVYRALTLADRLIDHEVSFVVEESSDLAQKLVARRSYELQVVPDGGAADFLLHSRPDVVVNDVLNSERRTIKALNDAGLVTVNFEDEGPGSKEAHFVINAMYGPHPSRQDGRLFHGVSYCCLRDDLYMAEPQPFRREVKNVLLLFGGTDPTGMTLKLFQWLDALPGAWRITTVAGIGFGQVDRLRALGQHGRHPTEIVVDTNVIGPFMAAADIAITSAGRTVFELASLGVPMAVVAHHEREYDHIFARTSPGTVPLGEGESLSQGTFVEVMEQLLCGPLLREKMRQSLLAVDIRGGIDRVLAILRDAVALSAEVGQRRGREGVS